MTRKRLFLVVPFLLIFVTIFIFFLFHRADSRTTLLKKFENIPFTPQYRTKSERLRLHPLASKQEREVFFNNTPVATWEDWINGKIEVLVGFLVEGGGLKTPEEIAAYKAKSRTELVEMIKPFKAANFSPPTPLNEQLPWQALLNEPLPTVPQTTEALMAAYDYDYPHTPKYDEHYPREEWLQRLLDKGAVIDDANDYDFYLDVRAALDQKRGDPNGNDADTFIGQKISQRQVYKDFRATNPNTSGTIYFPESHPHKFLPVTENMTYVYRRGPVTRTWGTHLTDEQRNVLIHQGVHPENIEIVYVDKDYNVLTEKPEHYDPAKDGIVVSDEIIFGDMNFLEEIEPFPETAPKTDQMDQMSDSHFPDRENTENARDFDADAAAQAEMQFQDFAKMAAEIERQLLPKLPANSEQFTPKSVSQAMKILNRYGPEEGLLRLKKTDPLVAEQIEKILKSPR